MNETLKFIVALIIFLVLVAVLELAGNYALYYVLELESQQQLAAMLAPRVELLAELGILQLGDSRHRLWRGLSALRQRPAENRGRYRIILNAHSSHRLEPAGPPELRHLTQAVNDLAEHSETLAHDLEARIAQAKASVEEEKHRLAALMSRLSPGRAGVQP